MQYDFKKKQLTYHYPNVQRDYREVLKASEMINNRQTTHAFSIFNSYTKLDFVEYARHRMRPDYYDTELC